MPNDIARVTMVCRLTRDPELRDAGQSKVLEGRVAWSTRRKRNEEWIEEPGYIDVVLAWDRRAEALAGMLSKGSRIAIDGRLRWREYETSGGDKRQVIEIDASGQGSEVELLDGRPDGPRSQPRSEMAPTPPPAPAVDDGSDLPF